MLGEPAEPIDRSLLDAINNIEQSRGQGHWTSDDLKFYLLSLAYNHDGKDFCLERNLFPKSIGLSSVWNEVFNEMRSANSNDMKQRWAIIGVTANRDELHISPRFVEKPNAYENLTPDQIVEIDYKFFVDQNKRLEEKGLLFELGYIIAQHDYKNHDLVFYLSTQQGHSLLFMVTPEQNIAIFRSHETKQGPLTSPQEMLSQGKTIDQHYAEMDRQPLNSLFDQYRLVVYEGKPNQPLVRAHPA